MTEERMDSKAILATYELMYLMREFEILVGEGVARGDIHGEMHLGIGQEIVAACLARHLRPNDAVVSTHRPHLHAMAAGVDPVPLLAEIFERDGLNHGKGGHMHLFDPVHRFMCSGIVGASAPIAAGYALKQRVMGEEGITVSVAGDGAMNQGGVIETMNLAIIRSLPMLFLVEDNGYSISVRKERSTAGRLTDRAHAFGLPAREANGRDLEEVDEAIGWGVDTVRTSGRPAMTVVSVYRFRGHYEGDADLYRNKEEKDHAMSSEMDPLSLVRSRILLEEISTEGEIAVRETDARAQVRRWYERVLSYPYPSPATALTGVYTDD
jgi:acetoin:2,6-dichlorophenolindophenol oxidoreductase subunit alpha